jgi:hypothetical protein
MTYPTIPLLADTKLSLQSFRKITKPAWRYFVSLILQLLEVG